MHDQEKISWKKFEKISYERYANESVDDKSLSYAISQKTIKNGTRD